MSPILNIEELAEICTKPEVIIVDVSNGKEARSNFKKSHILGAQFIDLNQELSAITDNPQKGGRHPLPGIESFISVLESKGIDHASHVICYDSHFGANAAARLWWMLRAIGHVKVQVLNGGFQTSEKYSFLVSDVKTEAKTAVKYVSSKRVAWELPQASIEDVLENTTQSNFTLIDVREPERFLGITEPIDRVAGHIPGAVNVPFKSNLTSTGFFKSTEEIRENYSSVDPDIIIHCGSGVTACHSILAMDYAGLPIPSLYVGSWSEWSRSGHPVVTNLS